MQQLARGKMALLQVPAMLSQRGTNHVLFVTGHHLTTDPLFNELLQALSIPYVIVHPPGGVLQVDNIPAFPQLDAIVAIGGGKVLDFAKGILYQHAKPALLVAAPTTAGSGSEATPIAVFYQGVEKISLDRQDLLPGICVLDPALLNGLSAVQKAISGADALAQSIESVWNRHSTALSDSYALPALEALWQHLPHFLQSGRGTVADDVLWAAHLAGKAIALTRTTGPHALSYFLTANYGVPHGQAVSLTLPLFFLYNDTVATGGQMQKMYKVLQVTNKKEAFHACTHFFDELGLATTLPALGLSALSIDAWLSSVNQQRFANNPVPFDGPALKALFQRYLQ